MRFAGFHTARLLTAWALLCPDLGHAGNELPPLTCSKFVELATVGSEVVLPWEADEGTFRVNAFYLTGVPRSIIFGTRRIARDGSDAATGGRFLSIDVSSGETNLEFDVPGGSGGPRGVEVVYVSRFGSYAISVSPHIEGPLHVYDLRRNRPLYGFRNTGSQRDWWRLGVERALFGRLNGAALADLQLRSIGFESGSIGELVSGFSPNEVAGFVIENSNMITDHLEERLGKEFDTTVDLHGTHSVDFSPDESRFLVDDSCFLTVRKSADGSLVSRYPISAGIGTSRVSDGKLNRRLEGPCASRFINNGNSVLSLHQNDFSLWNANSGILNQVVSLEFEVDTRSPGWLTVAARGNYFAFSGRSDNGEFRTDVFTIIKKGKDRVAARRINSLRADRTTRDNILRYPRIAFATNGDYLVGNTNGFVGIYKAGTSELKRSMELSRFSPVTQTAISPDGSVGAVLSAEGRYVQVWSLDGSKTGRMIDSPEHGGFVHIAFSPDNEQLLLVHEQWDKMHRRSFYKTFVVPVDKVLQ